VEYRERAVDQVVGEHPLQFRIVVQAVRHLGQGLGIDHAAVHDCLQASLRLFRAEAAQGDPVVHGDVAGVAHALRRQQCRGGPDHVFVDQARNKAEVVPFDEVAAIQVHPHHVQEAPGAKPLSQPFASRNHACRRDIGIDGVIGFATFEVVVGIEQHHVEVFVLRQAQGLGVGVGRDKVVGIDEGEIFPGRHLQGRVACRRKPAVLLPDHAHLRQARSEVGEDARAIIGGTVVDHDDLVGRRIQRGQAFQATRQVGRDVKDRHHQAEQGRAHCSRPRLPACQSSRTRCSVCARWA
jgi:hypothetical protein